MVELERVAEKSARGTFHLFLGNIISEILNAITIIISARILTPEEMGIYSLSFVLPGLFVIFSDLGLNQASTRFVARYQTSDSWGDIRRLVGRGFLFKGGLSLLFSALMFIGSDFLAVMVMNRPELSGILQIMSILVFTHTIHTLSVAIFYGLERMDFVAAMVIFHSVMKGSSALFLISRGYGVYGLLYGHLLGVGTTSIISVLLTVNILRGKSAVPRMSNENSLPELLRFGFPLFLTSFVANIYLSFQGILLAQFTNNIAIGNLDIANKFISLVTLFTFPITQVIYPAFSKFTFNIQPNEMRALYRVSVRYATLLILPITAIMIIFSGQGTSLLFGSRYELAPWFLSLTLLQFLAVGFGSLSIFSFLNSQGDTSTTFRLNTITTVLKIILAAIFTWRWGVPGLLIGLFISAMLGQLLNQYVVNRKYELGIDLIHTFQVGLFTLAAALISALSVQFLPHSELIQLTVGGFVFFLSCLFLAPLSRAFDLNDVKTMRRVLERMKFIYLILAPFLALEERIIKFLPNAHSK